MATDQTAPTIPPPAGYASWADALAAAVGGGPSQPIGMAKGDKPVGLGTLGPQSGPGLERIPGQLSPAEMQGTAPINDVGQTPNATPYKAQDILNPANGTPDQILQLQADLVHAGLLNVKDVRRGIWDAASQNAYKVVLAYANQHALSKDDAMSVLLNNPELGSSSTRGVGQTTNPLDVAAAVSGGGPGQSNTARDLIGQDLPQAEVKDFQNWYMQQEQGARKQLVNADLSGQGNQGGTVSAPPSLSSAAQDYIKQHNLSQMTSYGTAARMLQFFDLLHTPGGHP